MTDVEKRITTDIKDGVLFQFLGAENVERLKTEITNAIIEQVKHDLHDSYDYIISPDVLVQDIVEEVVEDAKNKIRPAVEKVLYERTMAQLGLNPERI